MLASSCRILAQNTTPPTASAESDEVTRLKQQLQHQREGSMRLLIELHDKHGAPLLETIAAFTAADWQARMEQRQIAGERNLTAVKAELWDKLPPSFKWEVVEQSPERLQFKVTACPIVEDMKRGNVPPALGYALSCASDPGIAAGINPRIKFSRTKILMEGGCCCDHTYELGEAS